MSSGLGLNISLPVGTLSQIRRNNGNGNGNGNLNNNESDGDFDGDFDDDAYNDDINDDVDIGGINEEDRVIMSFIPSDASSSDEKRLQLNVDHADNHADDPASGEDDNQHQNEEEHEHEHEENNDCEHNKDTDTDTDTDTNDLGLDDLSLSPPPSMPLLAVELDKLCGYIPSDQHEAKRLTDELCEALLGFKIDDDCQKCELHGDGNDGINGNINGSNGDENENIAYGDGLSLEFTSRAIELLEAGVARHSDTLERLEVMNNNNHHNHNKKGDEKSDDPNHDPNHDQNKLKYAFVPYPEFLSIRVPNNNNAHNDNNNNDNNNDNNDDNTNTNDRPSIMATTKIWKRILHPHDIPIVEKLLKLLSKCSRDIMWKHEMSMEIRRIANEEKQWQEEKKRRRELKIWRMQKRPDELAKLYDVRETFELKLDTLRIKYDGYVKERDERVERELQRRKEKGIGCGGIAGLDWDGNVTFAFDDDVEETIQKMLLEEQEDKEYINSVDDGYQNQHHDSAQDEFGDNHDDGYDCDDGGNDISDEDCDHQTTTIDQPPVITNDSSLARKKRRAKAASKRMRRRLETERENARAEELRLKIKAAHDEEEYVRQMCMNTDEKLAMVMVKNMEERLERIDDLLDSLQTDAWNDEEEGLLDGDLSDNEEEEEENETTNSNGEMNLLDSILAMILGAMPPQNKSNSQEHFTFLKKEHTSIVAEWKLTFGRIPQFDKEKTVHQPVQKCSHNESSNNDIPESVWDSDGDSLPTETTKRNPLRMDLIDSIPDDWENEADCDDFFPSELMTTEKAAPQNNIPPDEEIFPQLKNTSKVALSSNKTGLRPGGKL